MSSGTQATGSDISDPMTPSNLQEPFVFFAKLRKEKPVYWNEQYSFWMLTRYQDVKAVLRHLANSRQQPESKSKSGRSRFRKAHERALILGSDFGIRLYRPRIRQNTRIRGGPS